MTQAVRSAASPAEVGHLVHARALACAGRGRVSPNPLVGAVVVRDGYVVGEGWHEGPGAAHAEVMALRAAGDAARGATVICTLEPCSHHGRTPPCTDALIAAGVARVVVGALDPLERDRAGGLDVLASAGIDVALAPADETARCREQNGAFVTHALTGLPQVTLKMAASLDGRVATATGETRWITGPEARALVHRVRADSDAVAVGIGTVLADDPMLTARDVAGPFRPPVRVVFDAQARTPAGSALARTASEAPVLVVCAAGADPDRVAALRATGVEVLALAGGPAARIAAALSALGTRDIQSLMLEGGPSLAAAFLAAGAVDRVQWFVAPKLIGGDAAPGAVGGPGLGALADVPALADPDVRMVGDDVLIEGRLRPLPAS